MLTKLLVIPSLVSGLMLFPGFIAAQEISSSTANTTLHAIASKLNKLNRNWQINAIEKSPLANFYQVNITGGKVIYYSADTDYFFEGNLYKNIASQAVNMTERNMKLRRKAMLAEIEPDSTIVYQPENEVKAIVYAFIDVDCGACRNLHKQIAEMTNLGIEVRYLAYPRAGVDSKTYEKMTTAWCTSNRKQSIDELMLNRPTPTNLCKESPVSQHFKLGQSMGLRGTPGIVLTDGTLLHGFRTAKKLAKELTIEH